MNIMLLQHNDSEYNLVTEDQVERPRGREAKLLDAAYWGRREGVFYGEISLRYNII